MNAGIELSFILHKILDRQRLVRKAHVHHAGRVSLGSGKIDQTSFTEHNDAPTIRLQLVFLHERANRHWVAGHLAQRDQVQFQIKVTAVTNDCSILHPGKMLAVDNVTVSSHGNEDVAE